ncbi:MAG TPA: cytochrome c, partial [Blastocatellia bacterium]|nr:cytochrome c [Blastocatellia bacterium]
MTDAKDSNMTARFKRFAPVLLGLAALAWPFYATAHEPITTKVRFNKEVIRILQRNCLGCHRPEGAAMSLATYDDARPWAKAIKEEILERRMPPWHAVKGYGDFLNAPPLTQREMDLIVNWVEGGAPRGDEKDLPPGPLYSDDWQLGKPDLVLEPEREFEVASDSDERRAFLLPSNLKESRWLSAVDLRPGNRSVVHCATLYVEANRTPPVGKGAQRDEPESAVLAVWMPGQKTVAYPRGVARLLRAGSRVRLEIHYRGAGEYAKDR